VLYIERGKLIYETSMVPWVERIVGPDPLPEGKLQVRYQQTMTARPFDGSGAIFVNGLKVSEHKFDRCILSPSYDGLSVGADLGGRVSIAYRGTNPFQGKIERVQIAIDNRNFTALETMHFMREMMFRQ
jgi:arylsulfatase